MELRLALRRLLRQPGRSSAAVIAIALAITLISALFSILDGLLFRPLPFPEPDRLMAVDIDRDWLIAGLADPAARDRRGDALRVRLEESPLVALTAQAGSSSFFLTDEAREAGLRVTGVDARFFRLFGLSAALGTTLTEADARSPAALSRDSSDPLPIVISHDLWRRRYAGTAAVPGVHDLAGRRVHIVGVMRPAVKFPGETNVWAPVAATRARPAAYVRLASGATREELAAAFPELRFTPLRDVVSPGRARAVVLLFAAAGLLLAATWVQVAGLMFSQSLSELREIGVRFALGASLADAGGRFAVTSVVLAGAALAIASLAVAPATNVIAALLPAALQDGQYLRPDVRTFAFACAVSLAGFIVITLAPLTAIRGAAPLALITERFAGHPAGADRLRTVLLVVQLSLTCVLLYLAGLGVRSFTAATTFDYGFDAEHVLVFTPPPWARPGSTNAELFADFAERNRKTAASVALLETRSEEVLAAATFFAAPLGVGMPQSPRPITHYDGRPLTGVAARGNSVSANFVRAIGARVLEGRSFEGPDFAGRRDVAIVNASLARRLSPPLRVMDDVLTVSVIGKEIQTGDFRGRIIGVIHDLVDTGPEVPADPQFFVRVEGGSAAAGIAIRMRGPIDDSLPAVRGALESIWGPLRPLQFGLMRDELDAALAPYRSQAVLLGIVAAGSLPVAALGLMGALAHFVARRRREIAIRMALGADPRAVRRAIVRHAIAVVGMSLVIGVVLGAGLGSVIGYQWFQVRPADLSTIAFVSAALLALGWLAAVIPARRAARVPPLELLRHV